MPSQHNAQSITELPYLTIRFCNAFEDTEVVFVGKMVEVCSPNYGCFKKIIDSEGRATFPEIVIGPEGKWITYYIFDKSDTLVSGRDEFKSNLYNMEFYSIDVRVYYRDSRPIDGFPAAFYITEPSSFHTGRLETDAHGSIPLTVPYRPIDHNSNMCCKPPTLILGHLDDQCVGFDSVKQLIHNNKAWKAEFDIARVTIKLYDENEEHLRKCIKLELTFETGTSSTKRYITSNEWGKAEFWITGDCMRHKLFCEPCDSLLKVRNRRLGQIDKREKSFSLYISAQDTHSVNQQIVRIRDMDSVSQLGEIEMQITLLSNDNNSTTTIAHIIKEFPHEFTLDIPPGYEKGRISYQTSKVCRPHSLFGFDIRRLGPVWEIPLRRESP
ncbi:MAG: hypothetical protein KAW02_00345 [candidate division Zixibacteria bacterium]|nr:hypothetical protein [candidate division Zixibacteria bacterium]